MDRSLQNLAPHDPELAALHEKSLKGFKGPTTQDMHLLQNAITYFESREHPKREFWLRQCEAAKTIIAHYEPEIKTAFIALLTQEREQPDSAHWEQIQKVLPLDKSIELHPDKRLVKKLIALAHDEKQSYAKWVEIITPKPVQNPTKVVSKKGSVLKKGRINRINKGTKKKEKVAKLSQQSDAKKQQEEATQKFWAAVTSKQTGQAIQLLHAHKLNVNMRHKPLKHTALQMAVMGEDAPTCAALLTAGANPDARCPMVLPTRNTPFEMPTLGLAIQTGSVEIVVMLLEAKADPNNLIIYQTKPTQYEHLLCLAATPIGEGETKYTPEAQEKIIRCLLLFGALTPCKKIILYDDVGKRYTPIDLTNEKHRKALPLMLLATKKINCLSQVIQLMAEPEKLSSLLALESKDTPTTEQIIHALWHALHANDEIIVRSLLTQIKDPRDLTSSANKAPGMLHYCVTAGNRNLCNLLLDHGADPNRAIELQMTDEDSKPYTILITPLMAAIVHANVELAKQLIDRNADPNLLIEQPEGETEYPLCVAVGALVKQTTKSSAKRKRMLAMLLRNGATCFNGQIVLENTAMNTSYVLDPSNPDDQQRIQLLLNAPDEIVANMLECQEDTIIFKVSFSEQELNDLSDDIEFSDSAENNVDISSSDQEVIVTRDEEIEEHE